MRYLRELREKKGMTIKQLSECSGVGHTAIWSFEMSKSEMKRNSRIRIAGILNATVDEISKEMDPKKVIKKPEKKVYEPKKCLNENCPLNKNKKCVNDIVLSGKAPCFGKELIKEKSAALNYRNIKTCFR